MCAQVLLYGFRYCFTDSNNVLEARWARDNLHSEKMCPKFPVSCQKNDLQPQIIREESDA